MKTCAGAGKCGACTYITLPYEESLEKKKEELQKVCGRLKVKEVIGMDDPYHYRHKVYASFYKDPKGRIRAGLFEESTHRHVRSEQCLIQNSLANRILQKITQLAEAMHIDVFDEKNMRGTLRYAYIRVSHSENTVLLAIVIGAKELPHAKAFVREMCEEFPEIQTVILNYNSRYTSMVLGPKDRVLYGPGYICDSIGGYRFRISLRSFYQVNPVQTEAIYSTAMKLADLQPKDTVLDAYCGIGTISLCVSGHVRYVTGVESNKDAVRDAKTNAKLNDVTNCQFICTDMEEFITHSDETFNVIFLDPPRTGLNDNIIHRLCSVYPEKIVYISCNPKTMMRDLKAFAAHGYKTDEVTGIDNFPFTSSLEAVCLLKRKKPVLKNKNR
ncbi:MAG: 23S rRNA (uracil(1939)-C(5))-methyltransferase RlmD [Solobacterium sp.]|nr:23S rRNA (uracil(1939)-C(5))-methyltransferase RlmD [Solobacterium sp.]